VDGDRPARRWQDSSGQWWRCSSGGYWRKAESAAHHRARAQRRTDRFVLQVLASAARLAAHHGSAVPRILQPFVSTHSGTMPSDSQAAHGSSTVDPTLVGTFVLAGPNRDVSEVVTDSNTVISAPSVIGPYSGSGASQASDVSLLQRHLTSKTTLPHGSSVGVSADGSDLSMSGSPDGVITPFPVLPNLDYSDVLQATATIAHFIWLDTSSDSLALSVLVSRAAHFMGISVTDELTSMVRDICVDIADNMQTVAFDA
jgi:hypothetical protein